MKLRNLLKIKRIDPKPASGDKYNLMRQVKQEIKSKERIVRRSDSLDDFINKKMEI